MSSITAKIDRYKLDSTFDDDSVFHTTRLLPGPRMGALKTHWKRDKKLGAGAFGVVWREKEHSTGQLRAVKVISKLQLNVREVEALVEIQDHPRFFVAFLGWFADPYSIHIAMEYVAHGDLTHHIKDNWAKAAAEVKQITSQILQGLVVLHELEICHRDLKPQNILIASPWPVRIKITDFGISKQAMETSLRSACGTLSYKSPEQLGLLPKAMRVGPSYTKAIDIWALGVVVHEIMTAEVPFLEDLHDLDSMTAEQYTVDTSGLLPTLDSEMLLEYCRGSGFPSASLRSKGVGPEGIAFVESVMVANPRNRPSAAALLGSPWFRHPEPLRPVRMQFKMMGVDLTDESVEPLLGEKDPAAIMKLLHFPTKDNITGILFQAVTIGSLPVVKALLRVRDDWSSIRGPGNMSLLLFAAIHGQGDVLELLLQHGFDDNVESGSPTDQTPLHAAAAGGYVDAMKLLLTRGAEVDHTPTGVGCHSPLYAAAAAGHLNAINMLLDWGADINTAPVVMGGQTALHAAAEGGHLNAVSLLLDRGANVNDLAGSPNGETALQVAAAGGFVDAIKLLVHRGAAVKYPSSRLDGRTPLHAAAAAGHLTAINALLDRGASVNAAPTAVGGQTPLHTAAEAGHLDAVSLLLDRGARIDDVPGSEYGQTALHAAAAGGFLDILQLLLDRGAGPNHSSRRLGGQTPLHAAAAAGHLAAITLLLGRGAVVNAVAQSPDSQTALHAAAANGHLDAIRLLVARGVGVDNASQSPNGQRALHAAAASGQLDAINLLLELHAQIDGSSRSLSGQTALLFAVRAGQVDAVKLLLERGASVDQLTISATSDPVILHLLGANIPRGRFK